MKRRFAIIGLVAVFFIGTYVLFHSVHTRKVEALSLAQSNQLFRDQLGVQDPLRIDRMQKSMIGTWEIDIATNDHTLLATYHMNWFGHITDIDFHEGWKKLQHKRNIQIYELKN